MIDNQCAKLQIKLIISLIKTQKPKLNSDVTITTKYYTKQNNTKLYKSRKHTKPLQ